MLKKIYGRLGVALVGSLIGSVIQATTITGAGASFPYPIYAKWAAVYQAETGIQVNYQSIGSGGGQQQIIARTVDFGASDDPMEGADLEQHDLLQFPMVVGGIVPVVNIEGIEPGALKLTGTVLAEIFLGEIKKWNDARIADLNPELNLPATDIIVVHRADGSGTTFGWTNYLSMVSEQWRQKVGQAKAVKWPVGHGGKGNEGVAAYVGQLQNAIGYVEYAYAKQNGLAWAQLQNKAGHFVQPGQASFAAAAEQTDWQAATQMGAILNNKPGTTTWPITAASFILLPKITDNAEQTRQVLNFFAWAFKQGATQATELDYVPLPADLISQIQQQWTTQLKDASAQAIWPID